jgi:hypothetical protein
LNALSIISFRAISISGIQSKAIGRSRGGLTTKIHAIVDALGNPLAVSLTGGHVHDVMQPKS